MSGLEGDVYPIAVSALERDVGTKKVVEIIRIWMH